MSLVMKTWVSEATRQKVDAKSKVTTYTWQARYPQSKDKITNFAGYIELRPGNTVRIYVDNGDKQLNPKKDLLLTSWQDKTLPRNFGNNKKLSLHNYYISGSPAPGQVPTEFGEITIFTPSFSTTSPSFHDTIVTKFLGFNPTDINQAVP